MVNEKLGIPNFLYEFSKNLYLDILEKLKNKDFIYNENTIELTIFKNDKMKYHDKYDYEKIELKIVNKLGDENKLIGASFNQIGEKKDRKIKISNKQIEKNIHKNISIELLFIVDDFSIENIIPFFIFDKSNITSVISHEIMHSYDSINNDYINNLDSKFNSVLNELKTGIKTIDTFLHFIYVSFSFELKAHLVTTGIKMKEDGIKKDSFKKFILNDNIYNTMKNMREFSLDIFYSNLESDIDKIDLFLSKVLEQPIFIVKMSPIDKKINTLLDILKSNMITSVIRKSISVFFYDESDFNKSGKEFIKKWENILGENKNIEKYFEKWIKKFNIVGNKYTKKMGKLYAHLDESNSYLDNSTKDYKKQIKKTKYIYTEFDKFIKYTKK